MTLEEFMVKTYLPKEPFDMVKRPHLICNDGFKMSVQGSILHYCTPRITTQTYTAMEIGFPNRVEELLLDYAENLENPTNTVYPYVPVEVIEAVIEKHGGINVQETFKK